MEAVGIVDGSGRSGVGMSWKVGHSRVGGERSRAYRHPSGRLRPMQLNNGGTYSDLL